MIPLDVVLDATGAFPELKDATELTWERAGLLSHGTKDGNSTVLLVLRNKAGHVLFAETTLRLFMTAAVAFNARWQMENPGSVEVK